MPAFISRLSFAHWRLSFAHYLSLGIGVTYLLIILWLIPGYVSRDANFYAGMALAPYLCRINRGQMSARYLIPALFTLAIALAIPVRTTFFIAIVFTALLFIENNLGKLSNAFLFLIFLISPVFKYLLSIIDFPLRLWLSGRVAALLNSSGIQANAAGNQIEMKDSVFFVDPACAGLHMLILSLLICLFLLMYHQRTAKLQLGFSYLVGIFIITMILNIMSNFFRILLLVTFRIMPGTALHDLIGITCLALYVIFPLMKGLKPLVKYFGHSNEITKHTHQTIKHTNQTIKTERPILRGYPIPYLPLHGLFIILLLFIAFHIISIDQYISKPAAISLKGFQERQLENGIMKFENKEALVYVKPTVFYAPEHDPRICWTGSGYVFKSIRKEKWNGLELYTAILEKHKDKIYAAWWFDNGKIQTTDQILWRWKDMKGQHRFYLINVNTSSRASLEAQVRLLNRNILF